MILLTEQFGAVKFLILKIFFDGCPAKVAFVAALTITAPMGGVKLPFGLSTVGTMTNKPVDQKKRAPEIEPAIATAVG